MIIKELQINNLRNHCSTNLKLGDQVNIFYGKNGSGKTTILEAISILSISKSFLPSLETSLIQNGQSYYQLSCQCENDLTIPYHISIKYNGSGRKLINSSISDNLLPKHIIGEIPVIILSPDNKVITFGAPQDRRQFLDSVLSQSSKIYIDEAIKFKKILKQRNSLLNNYATNRKIDNNLFNAISEMFILSAAEIISRRSKFINDFSPYFMDYYKRISDNNEVVSIAYLPDSIDRTIFTSVLDKNDIIKIYQNRFMQIQEKEFFRGTSLFGPQKDDIDIKISGKTAKETASQGQHKSLLLSIKFAEYEILKNIRNESPIFLIDDIFSELDLERSHNINQIINDLNCQTMITVTNRERFEQFDNVASKSSYFSVHKGIITKEG
ncbi:MAG TPA: DNA replication and repair protein RecF [Candidatus Kapabacteria bacterium]|nr:DNA replication and repair protein RecF [Candidatus Kapabacteria bacterium]